MKGLKITTALERLVQMYEIIYIGTGGLGLNIYDHRKDIFLCVTTYDGGVYPY